MQPTDQQRAAIETLAPRLCVDASAGSGKTRVLVERIVHLLEQGLTELERIVAITFTDKAAAEMKARLRQAFRGRASHADARAMTRWRDYERRLDGARIATIHSFCTSLLREHALRIGLDPDFAVLADAERLLLDRATIRDTLHRMLEDGDGAARRLATALSVQRIEGVIGKLLGSRDALARASACGPLDDPAALRAAWRDVVAAEQTRCLMALPSSTDLRRLLRKLRHFEGLCNDAEDGREVWRLQMVASFERIVQGGLDAPAARRELARALDKPKAKGAKKNWPDDATYKRLDTTQKAVKDFVTPLLEAPDADEAVEDLAAALTCDLAAVAQQAQRAVAEAQTAAGGMDFDRLIAGALEVLRAEPAVRARVAAGIDHLLIDEFQDTDVAQLEIARLLCAEDGGPQLFVVGDAKQSIYYFRGAEVSVFQDERSRADRVLPLDRNFRTLPGVMAFVNEFFARSGLLAAVGDYAPMATQRGATGEACVEFLVSEAPVDHPGKWLAGDYRQTEASLIARRIAEMCAPEAAVPIGDAADRRPARYGDVAMLFRSMNHVYVYEDALRRAGVPYALVSGAGFFVRQEVRDVRNLLAVVVDPWDETALLAFLRSPMAGLSDDALARLCRDRPLAKAFNEGGTPPGFAEAETLQRACGLVAGLRAMRGISLAGFLRRVLDRTGYEAVLLDQHLGLQKAANVRKLVSLAEDFSRSKPAPLRAFVTYLDEVERRGVREGEATLPAGDGGAVTIMTIHKSKGLEFPVVFLPGTAQATRGGQGDGFALHRDLGMALQVRDAMGEPATPALGRLIAARKTEEERAEHGRVLYVAMTRARDHLVICGRPQAESKSWFETFDDLYGVSGRAENTAFGKEDWQAMVLQDAPAAAKGKAVAEEAAAAPAILRQRVAPVTACPAPRRTISVSAILDHVAAGLDPDQERRGEEMPARLGRAAAQAMARGTRVHRLFERWDFSGAAPIDAVVDEFRLAPGRAAEVRADLAQLADRFRASDLYACFASASGLQREMPFSLVVGDAVVTGTLDAYLPEGTIIDYKTGAINAQRHARYAWQLLIYAVAVERLTGQAPERGLLAYVDAGEVHDVPLGEMERDAALRQTREIVAALLTDASRNGR